MQKVEAQRAVIIGDGRNHIILEEVAQKHGFSTKDTDVTFFSVNGKMSLHTLNALLTPPEYSEAKVLIIGVQLIGLLTKEMIGNREIEVI